MRGQGILALGLALAVVAAGVLLDEVGIAEPGAPASPAARSSVWLCPHGGGEGWRGTVVLANPGEQPLDALITTLGSGRPQTPVQVTVPAGRQLLQEVPADTREAATLVEVFGGDLAAAWQVQSEELAGLGAEPCATAGATSWWLADPGTPQGDDAYLVVMNPFAVDAVIDIVLFTADRAPIRDAEWTDLAIGARRSVALRVDRKAEGEEAVTAMVDAKVGRVAAASVVVGRDGGIRSTLGVAELAASWSLPTASGTGRATLLLGSPADDDIAFGASLLSRRIPQVAGGLSDVEQAGASSRAYAITTIGPSSVEVEVRADGLVAAALRVEGPGSDDGATAGVAAPAAAWVVMPTVVGSPAFPSLVLVNPGTRDAEVTLRFLPAGEAGVPDPVTVAVPAATAVNAPAAFLELAPAASVLVTAEGGEVVAIGASTSRGVLGLSRYALVMGTPLAAP